MPIDSRTLARFSSPPAAPGSGERGPVAVDGGLHVNGPLRVNGPLLGAGLHDAASTSVVTLHSGTTTFFAHLTLGLTIPAGETHAVLARAVLAYSSTMTNAFLAILLDGMQVAIVNQTVISNDNHALAVSQVVADVGPGAHTLVVGYRGGGASGTMAGRAATIDYTTIRTA